MDERTGDEGNGQCLKGEKETPHPSKGGKMKLTSAFHPCECVESNGGQCYNCLNGAHHLCSGRCKKSKSKRMGVLLSFGRKRRRTQGNVLLVILVIVAAVAFFGYLAYTLIQAIKRIVPAPAHGEAPPFVGQPYDGGIVIWNGTPETNAPSLFVTTRSFTLFVLASDSATSWSNAPAIYAQDFHGSTVGDAINQMSLAINGNGATVNGMVLEQLPAQSCRFYNIVVSNWPSK